MPLTVLDAGVSSAIAAAASQQAWCEALIAPWAGGNVTVRILGSGSTLRDTLTIAPFTIDTAHDPRRVVCGARLARTHSSTGDIAQVVFRSGGTDIFSIDAGISGSGASVTFVGAVKALCATDAQGVYAQSTAALLPTGAFDSVTQVSSDSNSPLTTPNQIVVFVLHGSGGGAAAATGTQFDASCSGLLAYEEETSMRFSLVRGTAIDGVNVTSIRPVDSEVATSGATPREGYWLGFTGMPGAALSLLMEARLDALMSYARVNVPNASPSRWSVRGDSMGAWGCGTWALRRPQWFPAVYLSRPRLRYNALGNVISLPSWNSTAVSYTQATAPAIDPRYRSGNSFDHLNIVALMDDPTADLPWVGLCTGKQDVFNWWADFPAAVAAMRARRRGFAFAWNNGNHTTGEIMDQILASYPYGTFELGKGYPLFEEHSLDADPATDDVGGINIGLGFDSVTESASAWSCRVRSIVGACTVKVSPKSKVFTASVTPQLVTIAAANTWYTVSFTA